MSTEETRRIAREVIEKLDRWDLNGIQAISAPECSYRGFAPEVLTLDTFKKGMSDLVSAFPDARFSIETIIAEGDAAIVTYTFRGKHQGGYLGLPPTNLDVTVPGVAVLEVVDGKIRDMLMTFHFPAMLQQLSPGLPGFRGRRQAA